MLDNSPVVSHVGTIAVNDLDAVSIKVEYCSIKVAIFRATSCRCSVGSSTGSQCSGIEVPDRSRAVSGESDVRGAGFYAMSC